MNAEREFEKWWKDVSCLFSPELYENAESVASSAFLAAFELFKDRLALYEAEEYNRQMSAQDI